jgi:hypothetical protein
MHKTGGWVKICLTAGRVMASRPAFDMDILTILISFLCLITSIPSFLVLGWPFKLGVISFLGCMEKLGEHVIVYFSYKLY